MKIADYFFGIPLQLRSSSEPLVVAARINAAAGSMFWPFNTGIVGGVWSGHLRLRYCSSIFEYNAKPVLAGRVIPTTNGSLLKLRYRAPVWIYGFYVIWYFSLVFFSASFASGTWEPDFTTGDKSATILILGGLSLTPLALHAIGTHNSKKELDSILDFLSRMAGVEC
ncbi:MAG: hypothetical protein JSR28_14665 [Proteobacteria bacterium]|nr:hypothetical protein [Pseudomonadota bacterium]